MTQYARPDSDVTQTAWSGGYAVIAEDPYSDSNYITGLDYQNGTAEYGLTDVFDPTVSSAHTVYFRAWQENNTKVRTLNAYLYQGTTLVSSYPSTITLVKGTPTAYNWTLSAGEADAITSYTDLRVRFVSGGDVSTPASARSSVYVSWAVLEVPDSPTKYIDKSDSVTASDLPSLYLLLLIDNADTATVSDIPSVDVFGDRSCSVSDTVVASDSVRVHPVCGIVFDIDHEDGTFGEYYSFLNQTDLAINSSAALAGTNYGLQLTLDYAEGAGAFAKLSNPLNISSVSGRCYFDPNGLGIVSDISQLMFFSFLTSEQWIAGGIGFTKISGVIKLFGVAIDNVYTGLTTSLITITDEPHCVEVSLQCSSDSNANDAELLFYIDGNLEGSISNFSNNTTFHDLQYVAPTASSGDYDYVFYVDEIVARDDGVYIGEKPIVDRNISNVQDIASASDINEEMLESFISVSSEATATDIDEVFIEGGTVSDWEVSVEDTSTVTDTPNAIVGECVVSVSDSSSTSDTPTAIAGTIICSISDSTGASDTCELQYGVPCYVLDEVGSTDSVNVYLNLAIDVNDASSVQDTINTQGGDLALSVVDTATVSDTPVVAKDLSIQAQDSIPTSDIPEVNYSITVDVNSTASASDQCVVTIGDCIVVVSDSASVSDYPDLGGTVPPLSVVIDVANDAYCDYTIQVVPGEITEERLSMWVWASDLKTKANCDEMITFATGRLTDVFIFVIDDSVTPRTWLGTGVYGTSNATSIEGKTPWAYVYDACHAVGIRVHAWMWAGTFSYLGGSTGVDTDIPNDATYNDGGVWNYHNAIARAQLVSLIKDFVDNNDIDGVQINCESTTSNITEADNTAFFEALRTAFPLLEISLCVGARIDTDTTFKWNTDALLSNRTIDTAVFMGYYESLEAKSRYFDSLGVTADRVVAGIGAESSQVTASDMRHRWLQLEADGHQNYSIFCWGNNLDDDTNKQDAIDAYLADTLTATQNPITKVSVVPGTSFTLTTSGSDQTTAYADVSDHLYSGPLKLHVEAIYGENPAVIYWRDGDATTRILIGDFEP